MRVCKIYISRHVRQRHNLVVAPVGHPTEYGSKITQDRISVVAFLNVDVAGIPWFGTTSAFAIRYHLIAILRNLVERPFIYVGRCKTIPKSETVANHQVVENPCRVIGPGPFKCPSPRAAISAGFGVVIIWNADNAAAGLAGDLRDRAVKLAGIEFDIEQRCVWIA